MTRGELGAMGMSTKRGRKPAQRAAHEGAGQEIEPDLDRLLGEADVPCLLMAYVHVSGDFALMDRFRPFIRGLYEEAFAQYPEALVQELHGKLRERLAAEPDEEGFRLSPDQMKEMMSVLAVEKVGDEFLPLLMEQMGFEAPVIRSEVPGRAAPREGFKVLVIGAGLGGMCAAIKLDQAGYDWEIIEKNPEIGGTWYENVYPGVAVDTPSHFYSYSFDRNAAWSKYRPLGPEIQDYFLRIADQYELRKHTTFETCAEACVWDECAGKWKVELNGPGGRSERIVDAVIVCQGIVNRPNWPDLPGLSDFPGPVVHTARWDPDLDLRGKRVLQIGVGASGAQVAPAVARIAEHLTIFQRSKHWVMPGGGDREVPEGARWALENVPFYEQWFRFRTYWFAADGLYPGVRIDPGWDDQGGVSVSEPNHIARGIAVEYLESKLGHDAELLEKVLPDYPIFGKRIVLDIDYTDALARDNVELVTTPIERVTEKGIRTTDGREFPADAIVLATGFRVSRMLGDLRVIGRDGRNLGEEWGEDDPRAYHGLTVPGYPNFFVSPGPNSAPNHAAGQNLISEAQVHYILECLDVLQEKGATAMEPTVEAYERWNEQIERDMEKMVWSHPKSKSYYKNPAGRVFLSCPYRLVDYWRMMRGPIVEDYRFDGPATS
jgi:4-hydroxyacetophenone monooxygenase